MAINHNQTRIGKIPPDWKLKTISSLSLIPVSNGLYKAQEFYGKGFLMIHMTEIFANDVISSQKMPRVELTKKEAEKYCLLSGDLVFARRSLKPEGAGDVSIVFPKSSMTFESSIIRVRLKNDVCPEYVFFYLKSNFGKAQMMTLVRQVAVSGITGEDLKKFQIPLPSFSEQKKIAQILSAWDKAITTTEKLLANSKQQKKALMQQLLTGKKRFLGFGGEWKQKHVSDIAIVKKGKALSKNKIKPGCFPVIAGGKTSPYMHSQYTHENAITISASGAYAGYVSYHKQKIWASDCSVLLEKNCSNIRFIYQYLLFNQSRIYSLQSGGAQPHIYPKDIGAIKISIPDMKEQQKIAEILSTTDQEIEILQKKLDFLKQEKKALMQQLLTGKRRVKL